MERESAPDTSWKTVGDLARPLNKNMWKINQDGKRTQYVCCDEGDVGHGGKRLGGDDGDLDGGTNPDADNNLIADVLGRRGVDTKGVEEAGANSGEDCANEEKWLKVADNTNKTTAYHGEKC